MTATKRTAVSKQGEKTVNDYVSALVAAEVTAKASVVATQRKQLDSIVEALKGAPKTDQDQFKASWREPLRRALVEAKDASGKPYYRGASIGPILSYYSVAVCAITNGILPDASHGTLMAFVKDDTVRDRLTKGGIYAAKARRDPEPAGSRSGRRPKGKIGGGATTLTAAQVLRVALKKLGQDPDDAQIDRLTMVIAQRPEEFWKSVEAIPVR